MKTGFQPLLNCIEIIIEDLEWRNGTVQLLSAPLPKLTDETLLDIIISDPNFSAFSACKFLNAQLPHVTPFLSFELSLLFT